MKIIHIPFCFYPDVIGGTEVYVESLSQHLQKQGAQVVIAACSENDSIYSHHGVRVRRFSTAQKVSDLRELYGAGDAQAVLGFSKILEEEKPNVVHFHAFTRAVSVDLLREA